MQSVGSYKIINPRRACAARVTSVTWVIFSVCLFHQYLTCSTSRSQNEDIHVDYTCEYRHKIINPRRMRERGLQ